MNVTRCISSDTHVIEPPNLWQERIDSEFRSRAPRVVAADDADWWFVDGGRFLSFSGGAQTGMRFDEPEKLRTGARFRNVRPGAYLPEEHLKDNEADGVLGSVLYPTLGLMLYSLADPLLFVAICRAYNDWLAEFCRAGHGRLKGVAMLPPYEPSRIGSRIGAGQEHGAGGWPHHQRAVGK